MYRMLIICGGENIAETNQLPVDSCIWISNRKGAKQTQPSTLPVLLGNNIPTTGVLFRQMQKLEGGQSNSVYLDTLPKNGKKHFEETVRLFASSVTTESAIHHPVISNLVIRHPYTYQSLRNAIERALHSDGISEGIGVWIVSWFSDIYGIHRFVGATIADFVQRHYPTAKTTLNFVCIRSLIPPVNSKLTQEQESLASFVGILADIAFAQQIHHDFAGVVVRFFYAETYPHDYKLVADLVKTLTSNIADDIEISLVNSRCVPVVLVHLTQLGLGECIGGDWGVSQWLYEKLTQSLPASGLLKIRPTSQLDVFLDRLDGRLVVKNVVREKRQFLSALRSVPAGREQLKGKTKMLVSLLSKCGVEWLPLSWFIVEGYSPGGNQERITCDRPGSQKWIEGLNRRKQIQAEIDSLLGYHRNKEGDSDGLSATLAECTSKIERVLTLPIISRRKREELLSLIKNLVRVLAQIDLLLSIEEENKAALEKQLGIVYNAMGMKQFGKSTSNIALSSLDSSLFPTGVWCGMEFPSVTPNTRIVAFPEVLKDSRCDSFLPIRCVFVDDLSGVFAFGFVTPADTDNLIPYLLRPFVPSVREAIREWNKPNTWDSPSGKARMVYAGAVGDPLCLSALRTVVNDQELEKIKEIYTTA